MQDLKSWKRAARRTLRAQIAALDEKELEKSDEAIYNNLSALPELREARRIFLYLSVRREVDTRRLIRSLLEEGKTVALPVSLPEGQMFFAEYEPGNLTDGSVVPIPEPDADAPRLEPEYGDLILVPALTFDLGGLFFNIGPVDFIGFFGIRAGAQHQAQGQEQGKQLLHRFFLFFPL